MPDPRKKRQETPVTEVSDERLALPLRGSTNSLAKKVDKALGPTVRLVGATGGGIDNAQFTKAFGPPSVRLAMANGQAERNGTLSPENLRDLKPALLVSFFYLRPFEEKKHRYHYRDWVMDSGAFSAHASGKAINLDEFTEKSKELLATDPTLTEVFALDVIGDWKASVKNAELMWSKAVPAIPCFHYGEPWDVLIGLAKDYPKVAIGGCVGKRDKDAFAQQCFARVWPKKLHGFGFGSEKSIMLLPWHSVDATNWETGPCVFGRWNGFNAVDKNLSVRGSNQNLRVEVEYYLEVERKARERWGDQMRQLEELDDTSPTIRLAADAASGGGIG